MRLKELPVLVMARLPMRFPLNKNRVFFRIVFSDEIKVLLQFHAGGESPQLHALEAEQLPCNFSDTTGITRLGCKLQLFSLAPKHLHFEPTNAASWLVAQHA